MSTLIQIEKNFFELSGPFQGYIITCAKQGISSNCLCIRHHLFSIRNITNGLEPGA